MPYCSKCGAEISKDAKFCPKCGTPVSPPRVEVPPAPIRAKTGIDLIGTDKLLQEHWIKRVIAIIIDYIILAIALSILLLIISIPILILTGAPWFGITWFASLGGWFIGFPFAVGALLILYSSFAESGYGQTIGKKLMGFKVATVDGRILNLGRTLIRNISKIHPLLLLLDVIVGLATPGDPHQKYSDRIARTTVTAAM